MNAPIVNNSLRSIEMRYILSKQTDVLCKINVSLIYEDMEVIILCC